MFPPDEPAALESFYSRHRLGADGMPTAAWERENLVVFQAPYPLTLAWDLSVTVKRVRCHKLAAESLAQILTQVLSHYGSISEITRARMHLYGGCYNYRIIKDTNRLSTHAWGAGVDLDPEKNALGRPYDPSAGMMPQAVIDIFRQAGWRWGGEFSRPDCMHFQATG